MSTIAEAPARHRAGAGEMVPFTERLRFMQWVRLLLTLAVVTLGVLEVPSGRELVFALVTACYLLTIAAAELFWLARQGRGLLLFGILLMIDGLYLIAAVQLTGGLADSNARFLILLHVAAATLLASHRTGLKVACWHTLLLFAAYYAHIAGLLPVLDAVETDQPGSYRTVCTFVAVLWALAIATGAFSAANERELRRRRYDLQALAGLTRCLERELEPTGVATVLLETLADTYQITRGVVLSAQGMERLHVMASLADENVDSVEIDETIRRCWDGRRPLLLDRLDRVAAPSLSQLLPGARSVTVLPLQDENESMGVVVLERHRVGRSGLERRVLAMMEQFTAHAALAMRRSWLLQELRELAQTDGLTGVANRRMFDLTLERELRRADRNGDPVTLLLIDIDHFKRLNDTYGHQTGDAVLRQVGGLLAAQFREFDMAARYGGEEFAVILPGCPPRHGLDLGERLRVLISELDTAVPITVSIGVASYPIKRSLVAAADEALYHAKESGRNRVTLATSELSVVQA